MDRRLRQLLLTVLALLVTLLVGRTAIGAFWDDEALRRSVAGLQRSLSRGGEASRRPERAAMAAAAERASDLDAELERLLPRLDYQRPPEFDVPGGSSPDLRYIEVLRREQDALVRAARYIGKSVQADLGMPVPNPTGLEDVLSALRALHVVHLVISAGFEADVDSVDEISMPPARRRGGSSAGFLRKQPVEFDITGSPQSVRALLAALVTGEPWLALDDVRLEALDEDGESVRCRMTVSTVSVDRDAAVREGGGGR